MTPDLRDFVYSCLLTWVMLMTASLVRARGWTPEGFKLALGNRDDLPAATPLSARADRAAKNMLENLVLFAAVLFAGRAAGASSAKLELGAMLFLYARLAYFGVYLAGIPYLRTAIWAVGVAGVGVIAVETLSIPMR